MATHRGNFLHAIFEHLVKENDGKIPADLARDLMAMAEKLAGDMRGGAVLLDFWRARLAALADWFDAYERDRSHPPKQVWVEVDGCLTWEIAGQPFTLTAFS